MPRFVLYVDSDDQKTILAQWLRTQTHIQLVANLASIPSWLEPLPRPVLVDLLTQEAAWGSEMEVMMKSRKPPAKFSPVEDLD
jgi:hypothetical protein